MSNRLIQRGITALTFIVLAIIVWTLVNSPKEQGSIVLPERLAKLPRTELVTGPEAIGQISQLHQVNIALEQGYIAKFAQGNQVITLWISVSPSDKEGQALFTTMDEKIPASQVFSSRQELKLKGTKVVKVLGMGQEHYYWVKGKVNFWVAIGGLDAESVLEEVMTKV